jgi:hypothetical protein
MTSEIEKITGGTMRARDVRFLLKGKVEPDVSHVIEALAEKLHENEKNLTVMGGAVTQMMEIVSNMVDVADKMKSAYQDIKGIGKDADPDGSPLSS